MKVTIDEKTKESEKTRDEMRKEKPETSAPKDLLELLCTGNNNNY